MWFSKNKTQKPKKLTYKEIFENNISDGKKRLIVKEACSKRWMELSGGAYEILYSNPEFVILEESTEKAYKFQKEDGKSLWILKSDIFQNDPMWEYGPKYQLTFVD